MRRAARSCTRLLFSTLYLIVLAAGGLGIVTLRAWGEDADPEPDSTTEAARAETSEISATPTHRQTAIIQANVDGQPQVSVACFCLTPDDRLVAGCTGQSGELRVFDVEGKYLETWSAPVKPEAIFVQSDGRILLAGEGQLVRLTSTGQVELQKESPHTAAITENPEKIREEVIQQAKERAKQFAEQTKQFDQMIERADKEIATIQEQIDAIDEAVADADQQSAEQRPADKAPPIVLGNGRQNKQLLERRMAMFEQSKKQYEDIKKQFAEQMGENPEGELTEEQIVERVKSSIAYKMKVSSISATGDEVFLATRAVAGYGYEIWRLDNEFENATRIVSELRGCCGQMDVKANGHGLYVAENSRHRVCRFDREGKLLGAWGHGAREGIDGFGSCCNPMNVAFGPNDEVYTAEDDTGRIKRHAVDGKLLGVVGSAKLVPGCKNVSIAVSSDGSRVYMLDITRHHIVRLDAQPPGDAIGQTAVPQPNNYGSAIARGLKYLFSRDGK